MHTLAHASFSFCSYSIVCTLSELKMPVVALILSQAIMVFSKFCSMNKAIIQELGLDQFCLVGELRIFFYNSHMVMPSE